MRIVLAEDTVLLVDGLTRLLRDYDHEIVEVVSNADDIVPAVLRVKPDLLISDIRMPPTNTDDGLRAAMLARKKTKPAVPVLILSHHIELMYASMLLENNSEGVGYLLKDRVSDVRHFVNAVKEVAEGGTVLDEEVASSLVKRKPQLLLKLSGREREVLFEVAQGKSNFGIAKALFITESAVEKHIRNVFAKLELEPCKTTHRRVLAVLHFLNSKTS